MAKRGRPPHEDILTPAEWRTVDAVRHGLSNRAIARRRGVSLDAVKFHVGNAVAKLGLGDRASLRTWRGAPVESALARQARSHEGGSHEGTKPRRRTAVQTEEPAATANLTLGSIGQIARSVTDITRAEAWYRDVLGLPHLYTFGTLAFFDCGGTRLFLEQRAAANERLPRNDSVLYFRVRDIDAAYDALQKRGVAFTHAPHMIFRHADGTEEWMAFFEDSEGGVLAIMSQVARRS